MEAKHIRLQNLMELAQQYKKTSDFCDKIEMSPSYYSQVKTGKKAIGDEVARRTERLLGIPLGFMDTIHGEKKADNAMPTDVLGVAFSIEAMPTGVRDSFKNLIYHMALALGDAHKEKTVKPFKLHMGREDDQHSEVPKKEAKQ